MEWATSSPKTTRASELENGAAGHAAFARPVDLGNVTEHLRVGIVQPEPRLFGQVFKPSGRQVAICAVSNNAPLI